MCQVCLQFNRSSKEQTANITNFEQLYLNLHKTKQNLQFKDDMKSSGAILALTFSWIWRTEQRVNYLNSASSLMTEKVRLTWSCQDASCPNRDASCHWRKVCNEMQVIGRQVSRQTGDKWQADRQTAVSPSSVVFQSLAAGVGQLFIKHRLPAHFSCFLIGSCTETQINVLILFTV